MKIALITTVIHVPEVLRVYRAHDASTRFFVTGDLATPYAAVRALCDELKNAVSLTPEHQQNWRSSDVFGWNTTCRRNIALLEALKWGANVIVTVDNDNLPMGRNILKFRHSFEDHTGLRAISETGWVDPYRPFGIPHRGFPFTKSAPADFESVVNAKVGVVAGIVIGDPDISAITRIARSPIVHAVTEPLRHGFVVQPSAWTVFNSQNTAFLRELAPAMMMIPGVGRYDDIFASLICQRVMREKNLHVRFGPPFVWQQRNPHDLIQDLKAEIFGEEHVVEFAEWLDSLRFAADMQSVAKMVRYIYECMPDWMPSVTTEAGEAWFHDVEYAMS